MINFFSKYKIIFYLSNFALIFLYLFPGSFFGYVIYDDIKLQPQITRDFLISSNHFYVFIILSISGIIAYNKTTRINVLITYLFLLSIILEFFHIIIPNRNFELSDLFGNFLGVVLIIIFYKIKNRYV